MNKTVLITGSSRGIGATTAKKFASLGYNVIINYVNSEEKAQELAHVLEVNYNIKTMVIKCDISNEEEVKEMVNSIKNTFGYIDCLVNNAGIARDNYYKDKNVDEFRRVLDVNLVGTFLVTKYITNVMKEGSIVNVTSNGAIDDNYPESMDYDASKAGIISLTSNFAQALAPLIRVNAVAPGWVNTDMNSGLEDSFKSEEENKILLNRFGETLEVANVIAFLASDESSYINGTVIKVDGGLK